MLWTDKIFVTSQDLEAVDGNVCAITSSLQVDGIGGVIHRAMDDVSQEIRRMASDIGYLSGFSSSFSFGHMAAVYNVGAGQSYVTKSFAIPQVVVHDPTGIGESALKRWCLMMALYRLYRSQATRDADDGYKLKRDTYAKEVTFAKEAMYAVGIPLVYSPLHRPAADLIHGSGTFGSGAIGVTSSGGAVGGSFDVAVSYVSSGGVESALSESISKMASTNEVLTVDISSLEPPTDSVDSYWSTDGLSSQIAASGWNVYVRATSSRGYFYLQNTSAPIDIGTKTYTLLQDPVLSGTIAKMGQAPETIFLPQRLRMRA